MTRFCMMFLSRPSGKMSHFVCSVFCTFLRSLFYNVLLPNTATPHPIQKKSVTFFFKTTNLLHDKVQQPHSNSSYKTSAALPSPRRVTEQNAANKGHGSRFFFTCTTRSLALTIISVLSTCNATSPGMCSEGWQKSILGSMTNHLPM